MESEDREVLSSLKEQMSRAEKNLSDRIGAVDSRFECCKTALIEICKKLDAQRESKSSAGVGAVLSSGSETYSGILRRIFPTEPDISGSSD